MHKLLAASALARHGLAHLLTRVWEVNPTRTEDVPSGAQSAYLGAQAALARRLSGLPAAEHAHVLRRLTAAAAKDDPTFLAAQLLLELLPRPHAAAEVPEVVSRSRGPWTEFEALHALVNTAVRPVHLDAELRQLDTELRQLYDAAWTTFRGAADATLKNRSSALQRMQHLQALLAFATALAKKVSAAAERAAACQQLPPALAALAALRPSDAV